MKCDQCDFKCDKLTAFNKHINAQHKEHKCKECKKNPAYGRQRISWRVRLVAPILGWTENTQKPDFFEKRKKSSKMRKLKNV